MQLNKNSLSNLHMVNITTRACVHCGKKCTLANINKHEKTCVKPIKECPVCCTKHTKSGTTRSYSCSNSHFRRGNNHPDRKIKTYRHICFDAHGKKCIVCGEEKIVAVHHLNHDRSDNSPENLVPLCPTHHQYVHSRYNNEIQPYIDNFLATGKLK